MIRSIVKTYEDWVIDATKHLERRESSCMECVCSTTIEIDLQLRLYMRYAKNRIGIFIDI